jgi:hypothetical protein
MARKKEGIGLAGVSVSRNKLMKQIIDETSSTDITIEEMQEIINTFFSAQVVSQTLRTIPSIPIPGAFTIRLNPKIIEESERKRKAALKRRRKKFLKRRPDVRRRKNPYMKKYMWVYKHNKWREINGWPKSKVRIKKNTLLYRTMPSLDKMRERYPEFFKTHAYQKRKKTWEKKKQEGLNKFKLREEEGK